jgi:hypothetical protein
VIGVTICGTGGIVADSIGGAVAVSGVVESGSPGAGGGLNDSIITSFPISKAMGRFGCGGIKG